MAKCLQIKAENSIFARNWHNGIKYEHKQRAA